MLRPLFVSHGAPTLPFEDVPARHFLAGLAATMPRPRAIVVASAHWETRIPTVNAVARNETIHDFHGFPPELYRLAYPAPGAPDLAGRVVDLLAAAGLPAAIDTTRGLDHGAWVPLMLAWPDAGIPVIQLSLQTHLGADRSRCEAGLEANPQLRRTGWSGSSGLFVWQRHQSSTWGLIL